MKAYISGAGDPSVGLRGGYALVQADGEFEGNEMRAWVRQRLAETFAEFWADGDVVVRFDDEYGDDPGYIDECRADAASY
jgi:hypothetical protein